MHIICAIIGIDINFETGEFNGCTCNYLHRTHMTKRNLLRGIRNKLTELSNNIKKLIMN